MNVINNDIICKLSKVTLWCMLSFMIICFILYRFLLFTSVKERYSYKKIMDKNCEVSVMLDGETHRAGCLSIHTGSPYFLNVFFSPISKKQINDSILLKAVIDNCETNETLWIYNAEKDNNAKKRNWINSNNNSAQFHYNDIVLPYAPLSMHLWYRLDIESEFIEGYTEVKLEKNYLFEKKHLLLVILSQ